MIVKTYEFEVALVCQVGHLRKSFPRAVGRMEVDFRCPDSDINVVYLSSYLGKGEASGHRCDGTCQIEHVWANLYCCKSMNVTHVCDSNCDQRVLHDRHTTLCKVSGKFFPLTIMEQQAIAGVRRKRDSECGDSYMYKRRREVFRNPAPTLMAPFQRAFPVSDRVGFGEGFMDLQ